MAEGKKFLTGENAQSPNYEQAFLCYSEAIALDHCKLSLFHLMILRKR
jgi:hypothetical protein